MRNLLCAVAVSVCAAGAVGLAQDTKAKTKITVEDGKDVTVVGCVDRSSEGNFRLSHGANKEGSVGSYLLVASGDALDDLKDHLGHRVEIKGKAADKGDGRLKIKTESEVRTNDGDRKKRESTTSVEGALDGLPYLGVKSVRMLASVCP